MTNKKISIKAKALSPILAACLLATGTLCFAQQETVLHSFTNDPDGSLPYGVNADATGSLYGVTSYGGANSEGTVFKLSPQAGGGWTETLLHDFSLGVTDGYVPDSLITFDKSGNLYGMTMVGGAYGGGTVFELSPSAGGEWSEKIIHNFNPAIKDGAGPQGRLIFDPAGNLYGMTAWGGSVNAGTVFELTSNGDGNWTEKLLHEFSKTKTDGYRPSGGLTLRPSGRLFGVAGQGGAHGGGTVFELSPQADGNWAEIILHNFDTNGTDAAYPGGDLTFDAAGNIYGTAWGGGPYGLGAVFKFAPKTGGAWTETILHWFLGGSIDGAHPAAGVIFDASGNLYGTTSGGGNSDVGSVFELSPTASGSWTKKILYFFDDKFLTGEFPSSLILAPTGNLYGTTMLGGSHYEGEIFEIIP